MRYVQLAPALVIGLMFGQYMRADDYDDAKNKTERFAREYEDIRSLKPKEVLSIVQAMCSVDDGSDEVQSAGREIRARVHDEVQRKMEDLLRSQQDAGQALRRIIGNDKYTDRQSDARQYLQQINEIWERVQKLFNDEIQGGNHPAIAYMSKLGQQAHDDYYDHNSSLCPVHNFDTGAGIADCLNPDDCLVIELKPNNNPGVNKGKQQAANYAAALNADGNSKFDDLTKKDGRFAACRTKKFSPRVATYKACHEVDDYGNIKSQSYDWSSPQN